MSADTTSNISTPPIISIDSVAKYVNQTVTLKSKVVEIEHSMNKSLIELDKDFKVVVDTKSKMALAKAGINIESLEGKTIKITGKLYKDARYGIQMNLIEPSQITIVKETTLNAVSSTSTTVSYSLNSTASKKISQ